MRRHCSLLILSLLACALVHPVSAFEEKDPLINFLDYSKQNSEPTYEKVERGLATIPKNLRQALLENGYSIVIAPTMLSAMPGWQGGVPRGWSEDSNYDNVGGNSPDAGPRKQ